jgi:inorganic pyrophosphatase/exopolyphosphatase
MLGRELLSLENSMSNVPFTKARSILKKDKKAFSYTSTKEGVVQRLGYTKDMPQGLLQCFLDLRNIDSV